MMAGEGSSRDVVVVDMEALDPEAAAALAGVDEEEAEQHPALRAAIGSFLLRKLPHVDFQQIDFIFGRASIRGKVRLFVVLGITTVGVSWVVTKRHKRSQKKREQGGSP